MQSLATTIATNTLLLISFSSSIKVINETIRDDAPTHKRVALVYQHQKVSLDARQIKTRKDEVLLACLGSGHHSSLQQYLHQLDPSQDPICLKCSLDEHDLHHWLCNCLATTTIRMQVFGNHKGSLEWLATRPGDVVTYARKTLFNLNL